MKKTPKPVSLRLNSVCYKRIETFGIQRLIQNDFFFKFRLWCVKRIDDTNRSPEPNFEKVDID